MFNTASLDSEPGRYALIVESMLPPILIFILGGIFLRPGPEAGKIVKGRPSPIAFAIIWLLIVTFWLIALVIVALDTLDTLSLVLIGSFSLVCIVACMLWLGFYKYTSKILAAKILLMALVAMVATSIVAFSSDTPDDSKIIASLLFGMCSVWFSIASMFNFLEIQFDPNIT